MKAGQDSQHPSMHFLPQFPNINSIAAKKNKNDKFESIFSRSADNGRNKVRRIILFSHLISNFQFKLNHFANNIEFKM